MTTGITTDTEMEGLLYLEDGTVFQCKGFGYKGTSVGELVFNTSMTGYQEILTDPSYKGQIITMTYPLVGNYGISPLDNESPKIHAFGLVIKDLCFEPSSSRSEKSLDEWLKEQQIPGIYGLDTRKITKKIRTNGTLKALISTEGISISQAREMCSEGQLRGDWMKTVAVEEKTVLQPSAADMPDAMASADAPYHVAVLDFGVKQNILNCFCERNCRLTVYPYGTKAEEIIADKPDGIFLTNGPGDPEAATEAIEEVKKLIRITDLDIRCWPSHSAAKPTK